MVYSLVLDDLQSGRASARERLDYFLETGRTTTKVEEVVAEETHLEREERLRKTWGHSPEDQAQWKVR